MIRETINGINHITKPYPRIFIVQFQFSNPIKILVLLNNIGKEIMKGIFGYFCSIGCLITVLSLSGFVLLTSLMYIS